MKRIRCLLLILGFTLASMGVGAQDTACDLDNVGALATRAYNHAEAKEYELAIRDYTCALELSPDNMEWLNGRGIASYELGEIGDALADYNRILEIDPDYAYAYNNRGNIYFDRGDYQTAIADYTQSIERGHNQIEASYLNRGLVYLEMGEYDRALDNFNHSLEENKTYPYAYLARGWAYLLRNDAQAAYTDFARYNELIVIYWETRSLDDTVIEGRTFPLKEDQVYRFYFEAQAGQEINVEALTGRGTSDVDPLLVLLDPAGEAIMADDDSGVNLNAVIADFILPETGTYILQLSHAGFDLDEEGYIILNLQITDGGVADEAVTTTFTTYRLFINETAEVFTTEGDKLNLREGPGLDYAIVDKLERGSLVKILEGPHKADGYAWWRVRTADGMEGWAVEEVEQEQTLILALLAGQDAIITSSDNTLLNVRQEPGVSAALAFQLEDGTHVTLLEAPAVVDGFRWWKIRTADGAEGWAVDRFQNERTLIPARERD